MKRKCEVSAFGDDTVLWESDSDLTKLERDINLVLEDIWNFALGHKLTFNLTMFTVTTNRKLYNFHPNILLHDQPLTVDKHPKYLGFVLDPEILGNKHIDHIVLKARKRLNILRNISGRDCRADTGTLHVHLTIQAHLGPNGLFNLTIGAVKPHHLSQCLDPTDDLDGVFFHPELPIHVNKQADLPAYLKQLTLERIGDIPIDAVQVYTDGSRDYYYRSGCGIYIKSQDHILRIQRRNPDGCLVFRSELIAIDEALGSLASLPNGKEIWILSDSRNAIQHLSNWQSVRDTVGVSKLTKLKWLSTSHQIHLQWIPSHIDLEGNEIADTLAKAGTCEVPEPLAPLTFLEIFSRTKHQNKTAWITPPEHHWYQCSRPGGSLSHGFTRQDQTLLARFQSGRIK
ncbi:RNase H domain-containing protein [Trichonephila clavipes]|nr:RNase H domain-containing protein [Trichonephila clavipes]